MTYNFPLASGAEWNSKIFKITVDYRGHHWKGMTIYNATEVNSQQKRML